MPRKQVTGSQLRRALKDFDYEDFLQNNGCDVELKTGQIAGTCPFCNWKRTSFYVAPKTGLYICHYCLVPSTRVLTEDGWVTIGSVQKGDVLVGFDETIDHKAKYKMTQVESVASLLSPCVRIVTDRGEVTSSTEHLWVARGSAHTLVVKGRLKRNRFMWVRADELQVGDEIPWAVKPWESSPSFDTGWLSGILDGEGWLTKSDEEVGIGQNEGVVWSEVQRQLTNMGLEYTTRGQPGAVQRLRLGKWDSISLLEQTRPKRLTRLSPKHLVYYSPRKATILSLENIPEQEVVAIKTTSNTFIAEGFLSHNCGEKGGPVQLVAAVANCSYDKAIERIVDNFTVNVGEEDDDEYYEPEVVAISLPDDFRGLAGKSESIAAAPYLRYASKRKLDETLLARYRIGYCASGYYAGRLVVPVYHFGRLVNYIARAISRKAEKKVLTPPGNEQYDYLFNLDNIWGAKRILVVEGVFDALVLPEMAVASFGKKITGKQVRLMQQSGVKQVVFCYDEDAIDEAYDFAEKYWATFETYVVEMPFGEDPSSLGRHGMLEILGDAIKVKPGMLREHDD